MTDREKWEELVEIINPKDHGKWMCDAVKYAASRLRELEEENERLEKERKYHYERAEKAEGQLCKAREEWGYLSRHFEIPTGRPPADTLECNLVDMDKALSSSSPCSHAAIAEKAGGDVEGIIGILKRELPVDHDDAVLNSIARAISAWIKEG